MKLETGLVVLFAPEGIIGKIICWFQKTKYSHVGFIVNNWGVPHLNESLPSGGVTGKPAKRRMNGKQVLILKPDSLINEREFATLANSFLGYKYDLHGVVLGQFIMRLSGRYFVELNNKENLYCSEYMALCYGKRFENPFKTNIADIVNSRHFTKVFEGVYKE